MRWLRRLRQDRDSRRVPLAEPMEPRLLYSADLTAGLMLASATADTAPEVRTLTSTGEYATATAPTTTTTAASPAQAYASASLTFEANAGQSTAGADFNAYGSGYGIALDDGQAALTLVTAQGQRTVTLQLQGGNATPQAQGEGLLATKSNVIVGSDASQWATGLSNYASVMYRGVYDGVDLRYYGNQRQLEYDFVVAPGADAAQVALRFDGVSGASVADNGDLVLQVADSTGEVRFRAPVSYQRAADGSMQAVASRYEVRADGSIGFVLGDYDHSRELVIDPVLDYATYFGGTNADTVTAVATDSAGNVYITGHTNSTSGPFTTGGGGGGDMFVAKLSPDLSSVVWSTRIGGSGDDQGNAIAVDANGNVAVAGWTKSNNFPGVSPILLGPAGGQQAVVFKLDASGNLVFANGFDGNSGTDSANAVGFDSSGNVYAAGQISNTGLLSGLLGALLGSSDNAFVEKFSSGGSLVYQQQFGGGSTDAVSGMAVGAGGDVYVVGTTQSSNMPMSTGAPQTALSGASDGFLVHFDTSGNAGYSTFVGGSDNDTADAVAIDGSGKAFVVGTTKVRSSVVFTTTSGAFMTTSPASNKTTGYLREYDTTLTGAGSLVYSSYLGGSQNDSPTGVAYSRGRVVVTGDAGSGDFPVTGDAYAATNAGNALFLAVIDPAGGGSSDLQYGTFFGSNMTAGGVAVVGADVVIASTANTSGLATTGSYQATRPGGSDGLVLRFTAISNRAPVVSGPVALPSMPEDSGTATITKAQLLANASDPDGDTLSVLNVVASTGTLVNNGNGTWSFTPATNYNGTVSFSYDVSDGTITTPAGATLVVTPVNDAPVAAADAVLATRNTPLTISAATLLGNDSDVDSTGLTIGSVTSGVHGTAVLNANGTVTFTPEANYSGPASFTYTASDGSLASAPATVSVTVNTLPTAANDTVAATEDTVATYTAATLTANDSDADAGDSVTIASVASGTGGTAVLNADGTVSFTPTANFNGPATFTYRVTDGKGLSAPATVTVNVAPVNDPPVANADSFTTSEDNVLSINLSDLLANDTDVEGSPLHVVSVANGTGGTVVLNGNGTVKFTPAANFNGTATFTYIVSDGTDDSAPGTVTITVTPVNDPPVANDDSGVTNEDTPITFTAAQLLANDTDVENSPLTIVSVSGTGAVLNADGSVTFTPAANFNGTTSFSYRISDGTAVSGNGKVTITVNPVNDAPVAVADNLDAVSNTPVTYTALQLLGNDTDVDGDPLTIGSVTSGAGGTAVLNADGTVTFTPTAGFAGNATFTYTAKDAVLSSNPATVTVRVNDVPVANADTVAATEDTAATYAASALLGNDTDTVGNPLVISGVGNATGGTVVLNADGTVTFTPFANFNGAGSFTYTATDGSLTSTPATVTVNVAAVNDAPTTSHVTLPAVGEDSGALTITQAQLLANAADVDTGDTLSVVNLVASTGTLVANGNGTWTFTPGANYNGTVAFTYGVSDGTVTTPTGSASLAVTPVNDPPVRTAGTVSDLTVAEDSGSASLGLGALAFGPGGGSDETSQVLTYTVTSVPPAALGRVTLADGTAVTAGTYTLAQIQGMRFQTAADAVGSGVFAFAVKDNGGGADTLTQSLNITVTPVNDPPVRTAGTVTDLTVAEDTGSMSLGLGTLAYGVGGGSDESAQVLTYAVTAVPPAALGAVTLSDGTVVTTGTYTLAQIQGMRFQAAADAVGSGTFAFSVKDDGGGADTLLQSLNITVTPVNDPPVRTAGTVTDLTVAEDSGSTGLGLGAVAYGNGGGSDEASQTLAYTVTAVPASSLGTVTLADGTVVTAGTYTLAQIQGMRFQTAANASGSGVFTFTVKDNGGGTDTLAQSLNITVTPVNDAPVTTPVTLPTVAEDSGPLTITSAQLLQNASDADLDTLSVTGLAASTGTLVDNGNGTWTFTPGANYNGTVSFTYGVSDGVATTAGTASLVVTPVNDAPTTSAVTLPGMSEDGGPVTITQAQLLANAADVDTGDTLSVVNLVASSGSLVDNGNGTWTFSAAPDANGPVTFTYGVSDGTATVGGSANLAIAAVNDPPVRTGGTVADLTVAEDSGSTSLNLGGLAFGPGGGSDEAAQVLTYTVTAVPASALGAVTLADGTVVTPGTYTLAQIQGMRFQTAANASGSGIFSFRVQDDGGGSDTLAQSLDITVTPVNDAPTTSPVTLPTVAEDSGAVTITQAQLLANAGDVDVGDTLSVANLSASTGTLLANGNGTWTFTPGANYHGTVAFTYAIGDGTTTTAGSASLVVTSVNDAPVTTPVTLPAAPEDTSVTITSAQLLQNASDVDLDALTVTGLAASTGTLVDNGNGTWTFTPGANYNGSVGFTYGVSDGVATTAGTASLVVTPVNDAPTNSAVTLPGMNEDGAPVTITQGQLLANASDVDAGDTLSVVNLVASSGVLVDNGNGTWTFSAAPDANGPVTFTYGVSDGTVSVGGSASLAVAAVNDPPVRTTGSVSDLTVAEDSGSTSLNLGALAFGPGGGGDEAAQVLTYTVTAVPPSALGSVTLADGTAVTTGTYTLAQIQGMRFQTAADAAGSGVFAFAVKDNGGGADTLTQSLNITVTPVNDPPVRTGGAVADLTVAEDTGSTSLGLGTLAYGVGGGSDESAQTLAYTVTTVPPASLGVVTLADGTAVGAGTYTLSQIQGMRFQAAADAVGSGIFAFSVKDDGGGADTLLQSLNITVTPVNDPPVRTAGTVTDLTVAEDSGSTGLGLGSVAYGNGGGSDEASQTLAYTVTALPASSLGTVTLADGTVVTAGTYTLSQIQGMRFQTAANASGSGVFTFTVKDNGGGTDTLAQSLNITVTPVNDAPVTTPVTLPTVAEDSGPLTITSAQLLQNASDADLDTLSVTGLAASTGTLVDNGNGTWTFTPGANYNGTVSFTYGVSDGVATTAGTASLVVTPVNDAPTTSAVTLPGMSEDGGPVTITQAQLLANAADVDAGDTLSVVNVVASIGGLVDNGNGTWTFTPGPNYNGTVSFTYGVSDGAATTPGSATLAVAAVNDAPTTSPVVLPGVAEDSGPVTITQAQLLANAGDVDTGDTLSVVNLVAGSGSLVDNGNGTWTFTAGANYNGTIAFTYGISDGTATTAGSASLVVGAVNDAPATTPVSLPTVAEDSGPVTITSAQLLQNAADADADPLTVTGLAASTGVLADNGNGTWTFTPGANYNGTVSFTYAVTDGVASTAGTASLVVSPVNDAPTNAAVALPGVAEDSGPLTITQAQLLANAADVDTGDTLSVVNLAAGSGSLVDNGNGTWTFTPGANYNGTVNFTYGVSDGTAAVAGSASLVVSPVNDAPTTSAITLPSMQEDGGTVTITSAQLLANAGDVDGDALTVTGVAAGSGTLVDNGNGTWSFTPALNANGAVSFTYTISDGTAQTGGSATLQVVPVNDAPSTSPVVLPGMAEDAGAVTITSAQLLAGASDVDGDALSVAGLSASSGTLVDNGNGTWSFTPGRDFNGAVTFTYRVTDGIASTAGSAGLLVAAVDDAPQITSNGGQASATVQVAENTQPVTTVTASDVDTPAPALVYSIAGGADAALFHIDAASGALSFVQAPDFQAPVDANRDNVYDVVVQVSDGSLATQQALAVQVTQVVQAAVPPPLAPPAAPAPAAAPAPVAPVAAAPQAAPAPAPAATPTDTRGTRTGETLQEALGPSMPAPIAAFNSNEVSFATSAARVLLDADSSHLLRTVVFDRGGLDFISTQADGQLVLARFGIDSRAEGARLDDFQRTLRSAAFANQLDRLRESVREELDLDKSVTISVVSVSLGLSLVYILWLIRGGVLIGSYLSALPAWRMLDPLPVLSRVEDEDDDEDPLEGGRRDGRDTLRGFG